MCGGGWLDPLTDKQLTVAWSKNCNKKRSGSSILVSELNWTAGLQQQSCTTQDTSTQSSDLLEGSVLGLDLDGVSVSDTVLDLSVDSDVWSGGNGLDSSWSSSRLSDDSVTVLDADSDGSGLDSAVVQGDDLSGDSVNWCTGSWSVDDSSGLGRSSLT